MGEFNSDEHYIYYCGQESLRRNGVAIKVHTCTLKTKKCTVKNERMLSVHFQGKPFNITVIHIYALTVMLKKLKLDCSMRTYKIFQNTQNRCLLLNRGLECKSKKSRASWSIKLI